MRCGESAPRWMRMRSVFRRQPSGSVKWLYLTKPRVGWVRSLPLPGLSNTTPTTISLAFLRIVWNLHHLFKPFAEPEPGVAAGFSPVRGVGMNRPKDKWL